jgi:ABC-type sugar transport system permease subunit
MAFPGLIISGGMSMLIYLAALQDVPNEQYEAAIIEGASFVQRVRKIAIPQIKGIVGIMFIFSIIGTFNEFNGPLIMTGGGPAGGTETIILYAYKQAINAMDYGYSITMANVTFFIVLIITAIQFRVTSKND